MEIRDRVNKQDKMGKRNKIQSKSETVTFKGRTRTGKSISLQEALGGATEVLYSKVSFSGFFKSSKQGDYISHEKFN